MASDRDYFAGHFSAGDDGGALSRLLTEEEHVDRPSLWRLVSWGCAAVASVVVAILANQSTITFRRDQVASADLQQQTQQLQRVASAAQTEIRRQAAVIDSLNGDKDKLTSRVAQLERGLDTVTGSITRPGSPSPAPENGARAPSASATDSQSTPNATPASQAAAPSIAPAASTEPKVASAVAATAPASSATESRPPAQPDTVVANISPANDPQSWANGSEVARTEFAVDLGGANSVDGLRALWRLLKANKALDTLRPMVGVREPAPGFPMQVRLIAGPLTDAAAAARICASLLESKRPCETTTFEGQRLVMRDKPIAPRPIIRRRPPVIAGAEANKPRPAPATEPAEHGVLAPR